MISVKKGAQKVVILGYPQKWSFWGTPKITVFGPLFEHLLSLPKPYRYIKAFSVPLLTTILGSGQIPAQKGVKNRSF